MNKPTKWDSKALQDLGEKIIKWAQVTDQYTIDGYVLTEDSGVTSRQQIYDLMRRHRETFGPYIERARRILANKMVKQSFEGKASPYVLKTFIPYYMKDIDDREKERIAYEAEARKINPETTTVTLADLADLARKGELKQDAED